MAIALAFIGMGLGIVAFTYSPGVPNYTLTSETLTIHDRLYPVTLRANAVDVANIRVVDLDGNSEWRPTLRTNGFANSHYESGWFRAANGQKVRLYRAGGERLVLLPPNRPQPAGALSSRGSRAVRRRRPRRLERCRQVG